jgi:hypothetical protein
MGGVDLASKESFADQIQRLSREHRRAMRFHRLRVFLFVAAFWYILYVFWVGVVTVHT